MSKFQIETAVGQGDDIKRNGSVSERWPALLSRKEAAEYLGVGERSLSTLKAMGLIKSVKMFANAQPKFKRVDLDEYIDSLEYGDGYCAATQERPKE